MHKYLRAIGFSKVNNRKALQLLITDCIRNAAKRDYVTVKSTGSFVFVECIKEFAEGVGVAVRGEFDDNNTYVYNYYFPYLRGDAVSSTEDITIERHSDKESYAGLCDDPRLGVSLVFYLQNAIKYVKLREEDALPINGTTLTLSALSCEGSIMLPINKNEEDKRTEKKLLNKRNKLISAAREGDEEAIENLTIEDMDTYTAISRRIQDEDVFSLVDTYFMPYGVECDHYSILGEIEDCIKTKNQMTGEELNIISINCNDVRLKVCINSLDLFGEPQKGRRFKGYIWLQGYINFPR